MQTRTPPTPTWIWYRRAGTRPALRDSGGYCCAGFFH
jgi:hypothetical protein